MEKLEIFRQEMKGGVGILNPVAEPINADFAAQRACGHANPTGLVGRIANPPTNWLTEAVRFSHFPHVSVSRMALLWLFFKQLLELLVGFLPEILGVLAGRRAAGGTTGRCRSVRGRAADREGCRR